MSRTLTVLVGKNEAGKTSLLKSAAEVQSLLRPSHIQWRVNGSAGIAANAQTAKSLAKPEFHLDAADTTALANLTTENMMAESLARLPATTPGVLRCYFRKESS